MNFLKQLSSCFLTQRYAQYHICLLNSGSDMLVTLLEVTSLKKQSALQPGINPPGIPPMSDLLTTLLTIQM